MLGTGNWTGWQIVEVFGHIGCAFVVDTPDKVTDVCGGYVAGDWENCTADSCGGWYTQLGHMQGCEVVVTDGAGVKRFEGCAVAAGGGIGRGAAYA